MFLKQNVDSSQHLPTRDMAQMAARESGIRNRVRSSVDLSGGDVPWHWCGRAALESLPEISDFLAAWLWTIEGYRQRKDEQYLIELAIMEALTNIIRYAYPDRSEGEVNIFLWEKKDSIEIEIQDCGIPFDPLHLYLPNLESPNEGGYGVLLMKKIMNTIRYVRKDDRVNCLYMTRDIPDVLSGSDRCGEDP